MKCKFLLGSILLFSACKNDVIQHNYTLETQNDTSIKTEKLTNKLLAKTLNVEGTIQEAQYWKDSEGEHFVVTSETGSIRKPNVNHYYEDSKDAALYAYHILKKDNKTTTLWRIYDFEHDCNLDLNAEFFDNSLQITDLDNDNIPEIWVAYQTTCAGDVSPQNMKIIMYEGNNKYAMRGVSKVLGEISENGQESYIGGNYSFDAAFKNGNPQFKEFAIAKWNILLEQ